MGPASPDTAPGADVPGALTGEQAVGEITAFPAAAPEGSRFRREHRQGGVASFSVVYGPLRDDEQRTDGTLETWGVAIRTRGQPDNMILTGTYAAERGSWQQFETGMVDYAAIILQTLMHAALNSAAFDDRRDGAA
jgi:hypothetical protein